MNAKTFREPTATKKIESQYRKRLLELTSKIATLASVYNDNIEAGVFVYELDRQLNELTDSIDEWAHKVATRMLLDVDRHDYKTWMHQAQKISKEHKKILRSSIGVAFRELEQQQVDLIKTLPRAASEQVHVWAQEAMANGERFDVFLNKVKKELGDSVKYRAVRIARTETARARSNFTQTRAKAVGSTHYRWHTVGDSSVRTQHRALNGTIQAWDSPPVAGIGAGGAPVRAHAGCIYNCRCWAEPLFPDFSDE